MEKLLSLTVFSLSLFAAEPDSVVPTPAAALTAMAPDADPSFAVASIKPSAPDAVGLAMGLQNVTFIARNASVCNLLAYAYGIHRSQILGAPEWLETQKFDVTAKPDTEGRPSQSQLKSMLRKLLAERFALTFHLSTKELSLQIVIFAKSGPKLFPSQTDPSGRPVMTLQKLGDLKCTNATVADLAQFFQTVVLDRPVLDRTGLSGHFDFTLNWTPDEFQFSGFGVKSQPADDPNAPPDLFHAIQDQLGLKLEAAKAEAEVLVVDRVEKPSAN